MFNLFGKKEKKQNEVEDEKTLSPEELYDIEQKIKKVEHEINNENGSKELSKLFEQLGILYSDKNDDSKAIELLEKSLELELSMGKGYKKLMGLYNSQRAKSAKAGDYKKIEYYMQKMDEMRNIAKKVTLGAHKKG